MLEYVVGDMMLKKMGNDTGSKYAGMKVKYFFTYLTFLNFSFFSGIADSDKALVLPRCVSLPAVRAIVGRGLHHILLQD